MLAQVDRRPDLVRLPGGRWGDVGRILFFANEALTSLVLWLPALASLRDAYPRAWIGIVCRQATAPLARLLTDADRVIEDPGENRGLGPMLREFRPDVVICLAAGGRAPWAAAAARVRHRVGASRRVYSALFERSVELRRGAVGLHEVEYALAYSHRAGGRSGPARFGIALPAAAQEAADSWLSERRLTHPLVVLRSESSATCASWPPAHFVRLATLLRAEGVQVLFSVSPREDAIVGCLEKADLKVRRLPRFTGDLPTLAALLSKSAVVVGNSTGPLHLAAALGAPTLTFHGPWRSCGVGRWGPYAPNGWCLVADAPAARAWSRREQIRAGPGLLETLAPASALSCVLALLEGRQPALG
jgi:ADP-heptose:LPS heptosyltransferase